MSSQQLKKWNQLAKSWSDVMQSDESRFFEIEVNFPSIVKLLPKKANKLIDLGCGNGFFTNELKKIFPKADILGVDGSEQMIKIAKRNYPNIDFKVIDLEKTFDLGINYDLAICKMLLNHLNGLSIFAQSCKKLTALNGLLVISVSHPFYWTAYYLENKYNVKKREGFDVLKKGYFTEEIIKKRIGLRDDMQFEFIHRKFMTYINTFTQEGFSLESIDEPEISKDFILEHSDYKEKVDVPKRLNLSFRLF